MEEHIYSPDQGRGWGLRVWREMGDEILRSRELIWQLFMRDFKARYKQSFLGVFWALVFPVVVVGTFIFLNRSGLLNVGPMGVPYPVYVLLGLTIWQVFAGGLTACSGAVAQGGSMVVKINFPKETLVFSAVGQVIFELLVRLALLGVVMAVFRVTPKWTVVFLPLTLVSLMLFTLGLGLLFSLVNAVFRDVANLVNLSTMFLMFFTPVVYPIPGNGSVSELLKMNPLAGLVTASRDVVITGYLTDPPGFVWASLLGVIIFFFSWRVFHLVEPRIAERI